ncbi:hypothetical protein IKE82_00600 [Candidatus Saccharibacteria bacterium]|nr:hypothetical protein [Candidatus Saccharibacteria bacterium]
MKKSLSKTRKYHYILYIVPILSILTVLKTSALTYQSDTNIDFTINPTISMTVSGDLIIDNLTPGSSSDSNIIEVGVSTNASHGYYLSATVGSNSTNTNLTHSENNNYKFTSLSSNVSSLSNFNDNEWGYSYSTDGGTNWISGSQGSTTSGYNGLPLDGNDSGATGITLVDTTTPLATNQVKFKIGAKASNTQASGTYTNTINFYAVTYRTPATIADAKYLQDVEECPSTISEGIAYTLKDSRDETEYRVARLADNKCWLLDNLALDLTNADTKAIMYNSNDTKTNATHAQLGYLFNGGGSSTDQYSTAAISSSWSNVYQSPMINLQSKDIIPTDTTSSTGGYKVGGYYNFCAASAGTYCWSESSAPSDNQDGVRNIDADICPKGWRLPTGNSNGEFNALWTNNNYNTYTNYRSALRLPLSGLFISDTIHDQGSYGYFWSSTRNNNYKMYRLYLSSSSVLPSNPDITRNYGISIRCLFSGQ